jgi:cytochrome P450
MPKIEIESLMDTVEREPWQFYERLLAGGGRWDERLQAWIIPSYEGCRQVLRNEKRLFRHPAEDTPPDDPYRRFEGRMQLNLMTGETQTRVHNWFVAQFHPRNVDRWREPLIRPVIERILERVVHRGEAELASELVEPIPVRVIAAVMGLPWQDDELIDHYKQLLDIKLAYFNGARATHGGPAPGTPEEHAAATQRMLDMVRVMGDLLLPTIHARRGERGDDLISRLWDDGPTLLDGWGDEEMCSAVIGTFFAGTDTTTHAICNGLYMLMTQPGLADRVQASGDRGLVVFADEVLRLAGSVHFRPRIANVDQEIDGCPIRKDDRVITVNMAANRDPAHYPHPAEVDLERAVPQDHMAFNFGARYCVGAPLARAEIQEIVRAVLERLPNLRLEPDADPPAFSGFLLRSYRPLYALFDAG